MSIALVLTLPLPLPLALLIHFQLAGGLLTECFHLNYIFNLLSCNLCKSICVYKMYVLIYKYIRSNDMWIIYARVSENWEHTSIVVVCCFNFRHKKMFVSKKNHNLIIWPVSNLVRLPLSNWSTEFFISNNLSIQSCHKIIVITKTLFSMNKWAYIEICLEHVKNSMRFRSIFLDIQL